MKREREERRRGGYIEIVVCACQDQCQGRDQAKPLQDCGCGRMQLFVIAGINCKRMRGEKEEKKELRWQKLERKKERRDKKKKREKMRKGGR